MKIKHSLRGIILSGSAFTALLAMLIVRACFPRIILPDIDSSFVLVISLISLVTDSFISTKVRQNYLCLALLSAFVFGFFPLASLLVFPIDTLKLSLLGALIFTVTSFIFDSITDRISINAGKLPKLTALISAFVMYLAAQCIITII